jgi:hypothetical protein
MYLLHQSEVLLISLFLGQREERWRFFLIRERSHFLFF